MSVSGPESNPGLIPWKRRDYRPAYGQVQQSYGIRSLDNGIELSARGGRQAGSGAAIKKPPAKPEGSFKG